MYRASTKPNMQARCPHDTAAFLKNNEERVPTK